MINLLLLKYFLMKLQKIFKKEIIVSIHPKYNLRFIKKKLQKFRVVKYKTRKLIQNSFLITDFGSSSVIDGLILKKNIISLISPYIINSINVYSKVLKLYEYNIVNKEELNKKKILSILKKNKAKYSTFLKSRHHIKK